MILAQNRNNEVEDLRHKAQDCKMKSINMVEAALLRLGPMFNDNPDCRPGNHRIDGQSVFHSFSEHSLLEDEPDHQLYGSGSQYNPSSNGRVHQEIELKHDPQIQLPCDTDPRGVQSDPIVHKDPSEGYISLTKETQVFGEVLVSDRQGEILNKWRRH